MYKNKYVSVVIPAAGLGKRMKSKINKQFIKIKNKPILAYTIEKFEECKYVDEIVVVTRKEEMEFCKVEVIEKYGFKKVKGIVEGGKERQDSVYNGLLAVSENCDIVLIHDGARPFVSIKNIVDGIKGVLEYKACVIGVPVKDTIKKVNDQLDVVDTPKRSELWAVQTPQCFDYNLILKAYRRLENEQIHVTDDSNLVELLGHKVKMIKGSYDNIKVTTPEDLKIGEVILESNQK
ncbi:2-C-methyl-D-erythritol 4-phosphate cytidylyltransferase [Thermohalobacter berrensis]|uniref:2-C-methyl-D-erythritol 4-phosphate cytidylyltransferase n=1 Tax=Thermohalobacter berrensis TaxID=99594 RepID=A0A419T8R2_9FIRM|nr:2-C-methyl-D-erythritol 4-phosphate cytidylyltransferase [Thermohalobacter berrensis]RKD33766.1 2-C-methyl-D-erythritol 4-phosphate cytidylyltransferase [Thermohalobacter berrensis]